MQLYGPQSTPLGPALRIEEEDQLLQPSAYFASFFFSFIIIIVFVFAYRHCTNGYSSILLFYYFLLFSFLYYITPYGMTK